MTTRQGEGHRVPDAVFLENGYTDIRGMSDDIQSAYVSDLEVSYDPGPIHRTRTIQVLATRRRKKLIEAIRAQFPDERDIPKVLYILNKSDLLSRYLFP